jgi:hypothetical protein
LPAPLKKEDGMVVYSTIPKKQFTPFSLCG